MNALLFDIGGIKQATLMLKAGDRVEVDATKGVVKKP